MSTETIKNNGLGLVHYQVFSNSLSNCIRQIIYSVNERNTICSYVACLNPHSYVIARSRSLFAEVLKKAKWLLPDGFGIVLASRLSKRSIKRRITGYDLFWGVHSALNGRVGGRVFFLGSSEDTLESIRKRMRIDFPNVEVVGTYSPPFAEVFSEKENTDMIDAINRARPDVLWVGMTAPKQEEWLYVNQDRLNVPVAGAVGAVFDFYAGKVKRSPAIFRRLGLEWLPRLIQQPRRLWRRTFISAPLFMLDVVKWSMRRRREKE